MRNANFLSRCLLSNTKSKVPTLIIATAIAWGFPAAGRGDVKVEHKPVEVETKTYDHQDPPKDVHGLGHHESGLTTSEFDCKIALSIAPGVQRPQPNGKCQQSLVIRSVKMTVALKITLWLPDNATDKLKAHEEGHRQMAEKVFRDRAEQAALLAARVIDGRRITAEADDCNQIDKAVEQAIGDANKKVYQAYLAGTADVSARAGEIYDEITGHGVKDVDEATATAQAFTRQAEEAKQSRGATTKAAARPTGPKQPASAPQTASH